VVLLHQHLYLHFSGCPVTSACCISSHTGGRRAQVAPGAEEGEETEAV
jgi:hypothetical protein